MNELLSTKTLDEEIKKDAQRKATRIMAATKQEVEKIEGAVGPRLDEAKSERVKKNEKDLTSFEDDLKAALPLEKERFWVTYMEKATQDAMNEYLEKLSEAERIKLALKNLPNCKKVLKEEKVNLFVYGFDPAQVKKTIGKQLSINEVSKTDFNKTVIEDAYGVKNKCGVIIETQDKKIRCTLTLSKVMEELQDEYRVELCDALFGKDSFEMSNGK